MKKKSNSMFLPALTYAGIIIGVLIIHTIVMDILELYFSTYNNIAGVALPLIGVGLAIYGYRKEYKNNYISYQKALGFGVLVSFIIALIMSVFSFIYTKYFNPELIEIGRRMAEERLIARGMSDDMIEQAMEQQKRFQTPFIMILSGTLMLTLFGTIFSLIAAAVLKNEPKDPFTETEVE